MVEVTGQHGTFAFKVENPVEIGLAVVEALTGQRICQPHPYRRATDLIPMASFVEASFVEGDAQ